jgi:hypothetical protein
MEGLSRDWNSWRLACSEWWRGLGSLDNGKIGQKRGELKWDDSSFAQCMPKQKDSVRVLNLQWLKHAFNKLDLRDVSVNDKDYGETALACGTYPNLYQLNRTREGFMKRQHITATLPDFF